MRASEDANEYFLHIKKMFGKGPVSLGWGWGMKKKQQLTISWGGTKVWALDHPFTDTSKPDHSSSHLAITGYYIDFQIAPQAKYCRRISVYTVYMYIKYTSYVISFRLS